MNFINNMGESWVVKIVIKKKYMISFLCTILSFFFCLLLSFKKPEACFFYRSSMLSYLRDGGKDAILRKSLINSYKRTSVYDEEKIKVLIVAHGYIKYRFGSIIPLSFLDIINVISKGKSRIYSPSQEEVEYAKEFIENCNLETNSRIANSINRKLDRGFDDYISSLGYILIPIPVGSRGCYILEEKDLTEKLQRKTLDLLEPYDVTK